MKVISLVPLTFGNDKIEVGQELELSDYSAEKLIQRGVVALPPKKKKKSAKKPADE
jgi:hypothetical protein|tara:strand:+ start:150 stop:317 length:168 start_codon:yes stop_codon:yes gene_type:complete